MLFGTELERRVYSHQLEVVHDNAARDFGTVL
jgi:hypothetical protein